MNNSFFVGNLSLSVFNVLSFIERNNSRITQRDIAESTGYSLGKVNQILKRLKENNQIDGDLRITSNGIKELEPYRVKNAIIMAAGMSSRFAPLSYEKPKALLKVKGDILIEREIEQLKEAGIDEIILVVGYMKEKLFYLEKKYDVKIVVNEEYYKYNNPSTLYCVQNYLDNSYICSSDNYFVINPFEKYVYKSYYSAVYEENDTDEYCMYVDKNDRIKKVTFGGKQAWYMLGHVYWDRNFSLKFKDILLKEYCNPVVRANLWENLYASHIDELDLYIRRYDKEVIKEFDSLDELRAFDNNYLKESNSEVIDNICKVLNCESDEITGIVPIKEGLTNLSFKFSCNNQKYVYRHPGAGTEEYINRSVEAESMVTASELGLDNTFIYMDANKGWKISRYIENARILDYHNPLEVDMAINALRELHKSSKVVHGEFDVFNEIHKFIEHLGKSHRADFEDFIELISKIEQIKTCIYTDNFPKCLCHCDSYAPNILFDENNKLYLIDWEYSSMADPGCDIGTFIVCSDYTEEEADEVIRKYLAENYNDSTYRHMIACLATSAFYWFVWAIYQESLGKKVGEYLYIWYKYSQLYCSKALKLYED